MKVTLPAQVCVLDIETEKAIRGEVSKTPLAFAGVKVYNLHSGRYYPCKQRVFLPEDIEELETLLRKIDGIVLGHNILRFDYAVLGSHVSLEGIEEKTVDTFLFMYEKVSTGTMENGMLKSWVTDPGLGYFSLDNLAKFNFGEGKTISGRSVPKLWREGHRQTVIDYNEKDLSLTYRVWRRLVEGVEILLRETQERGAFSFEEVPEKVEASSADRLRLTGQRPLFNTRRVLVMDGPEMEIPPPNEEPGWSKWFEMYSGIHYVHEDMLMIQNPMVADFAMDLTLAGGPYPASWFDLKVTNEGPVIPERPSKEDMLDLMDM